MQNYNMIDTTEIRCKYTELLTIYNLDLVKFRRLKKVDLSNPLHRWAIFFNKKYNKEQFEKVIEMDQNIKAAHESSQEFLQDEQTRHEYDLVKLVKSQYRSEKKYIAEKSLEEGIEIGEERGLKKGEERGLKKGEERGKLYVAKSLKRRGMSVNEINELTGLTLDKINKI